MISKALKAIIMGPPGSGKGTISTRIIKDFQMKHLSSGDLLRAQILNQTSQHIFLKSVINMPIHKHLHSIILCILNFVLTIHIL